MYPFPPPRREGPPGVVAVVVTALVDVPDGGILDATHRGGEDAAAPLHRVFAIRSDHFIFQGTYYYRRKKRVIRTSPPIEEEADALNKIKKGGMDYGDGWLVLAHVWLVLHSLVRIPFFFFFFALSFSRLLCFFDANAEDFDSVAFPPEIVGRGNSI